MLYLCKINLNLNKMKKVVILFIVVFGISFAKANPVTPIPILITEMYIDSNNKWTIELFIYDFGPTITNLDSVKLVTSSGEALFKSGITVSQNEIILITEDSLQSPLSINRYGDNIKLMTRLYSTWIQSGNSLVYGDDPNTCVCTFPRLGQSIELANYINPTNGETDYLYVKSSIPSLGTYPSDNAINSPGSLSGHVYDSNNNPIENHLVYINVAPSWYGPFPMYFELDTNRYFNCNLVGKYYNISVRLNTTDAVILDTIIAIEPDSATICDFHLNITNGISEYNLIKSNIMMSNYPNPFKDNTTIEIKSPNNMVLSNAIIKIFNNLGEIVRIIPVGDYNNAKKSYSVSVSNNKNQSLDSGIYFYTLEIDGKKVSSNKMIIIK